MPTAYTAPVCDGKVTELRDFAYLCARAFMPLMTMREDPLSADIPDEIKPSQRPAEQYAEAKARLEFLRGLTPEQAEVEAHKAWEADSGERTRWNQSNTLENERLDAMLSKVQAWSPPTGDHAELKRYMAEQLKRSKHTYQHPIPAKMSGAEWLENEIARAKKEMEYEIEEQRKANERAAFSTRWIKALKAST